MNQLFSSINADRFNGCLQLKDLLQTTKQILRDGNIDSYIIDSEIILSHVLGFHDRSALISSQYAYINPELRSIVTKLVNRRLQREPIAYITGFKHFWDLQITVSPDTLIPRPESELVVEVAIAFAKNKLQYKKELRYLDLATGSGAILLATTKELRLIAPSVLAIGTDISRSALSIAKINADNTGIDVTLINTNWLTAFRPGHYFDIITCNPPYISSKEIATLQDDVAIYEPHIALTDYADGLSHYRIIANNLCEYLSPQGLAIFECGHLQAARIANIFRQSKLKIHSITNDLAGIPRVLGMQNTESSAD